MPLINSSFQSNLTDQFHWSKRTSFHQAGWKQKQTPDLSPSSPHPMEVHCQVLRRPWKTQQKSFTGQQNLGHKSHVGRKEPSMSSYLWQLSSLTFKRSLAQKRALTTHYHENCGEKKAKFCLAVWWQTSIPW